MFYSRKAKLTSVGLLLSFRRLPNRTVKRRPTLTKKMRRIAKMKTRMRMKIDLLHRGSEKTITMKRSHLLLAARDLPKQKRTKTSRKREEEEALDQQVEVAVESDQQGGQGCLLSQLRAQPPRRIRATQLLRQPLLIQALA
jgi:hypothetical protein